jgi:hypothetical protein
MPAPLFDETRSSILSKRSNWEQMVERLDALELDPQQILQLCVVVSKTSIADVFAKILHSGRGNFTLHESELAPGPSDVSQFRIRRKLGRKFPRSLEGEFLIAPTGYKDTHLLVWIEPARFWHDVIAPFVGSLYPTLVRPFYTQPEMHSFLKNVQNEGRSVRILRLNSRERLRLPGSRKRYASDLRWTDSDIDSAFSSARQENVWFKSIAFELVREVKERLVSEDIKATISKNAYFSCTRSFSQFFRSIVEPMVRIGHERLVFFGNRDRRATSFAGPRPVKIRYDSDIFNTAEQTKKLLEAMKRFKHGTCSVLHANPYLHVSVVDNYDNSSADVWVLAKSEILIVPQIKTSDAALERVVNHIFEHFREGTIAEDEITQASV